MYNKIILVGRLTHEHNAGTTNSGKKYLHNSIAVSRPYDKDKTDFFNITAWEKKAELLYEFTGKGDKVMIEGEIHNVTYTDGEGNTRYTHEVIVSNVLFLQTRKNDKPAKNKPAKNKPAKNEDNDYPF